MRIAGRRGALKALGAAITALSPNPGIGLAAKERDVTGRNAALKVLRWKRFVQGDEELWSANTRQFTRQTGVSVQLESVNGEDLRPKGAMAASVGAGPDILIGPSDMPQLYPDHCIDMTSTAAVEQRPQDRAVPRWRPQDALQRVCRNRRRGVGGLQRRSGHREHGC
jgi:hypothetical protein